MADKCSDTAVAQLIAFGADASDTHCSGRAYDATNSHHVLSLTLSSPSTSNTEVIFSNRATDLEK